MSTVSSTASVTTSQIMTPMSSLETSRHSVTDVPFFPSQGTTRSALSFSRYRPYHHRVPHALDAEVDDAGTDGSDGSLDGESTSIARLRLASRSVSPCKDHPTRSSRHSRAPAMPFHNRDTAFHRRTHSHPTLDLIPRYVVLPLDRNSAQDTPRQHRSSDPGSRPRAVHFREPYEYTYMTSTGPSTPVSMGGTTPRRNTMPFPALKSPGTPGRMVLVNQAVAAHLKKGGVVNVKSQDGQRRWKVYLPGNGSPVVRSA